jgi:hypothetical protein
MKYLHKYAWKVQEHLIGGRGNRVLCVESRVEKKIFVFVFLRKFPENLFSLFAKKAYKKLQK